MKKCTHGCYTNTHFFSVYLKLLKKKITSKKKVFHCISTYLKDTHKSRIFSSIFLYKTSNLSYFTFLFNRFWFSMGFIIIIIIKIKSLENSGLLPVSLPSRKTSHLYRISFLLQNPYAERESRITSHLISSCLHSSLSLSEKQIFLRERERESYTDKARHHPRDKKLFLFA